jgi:hypothetical protein
MTRVNSMASISVSGIPSSRGGDPWGGLRFALPLLALALVLDLGLAVPVHAAVKVHQSPEDFLREAFPAGEPAKKVLWVSGALKGQVEQVMGHPLGLLRVRYWTLGERTAWILEEIGKIELITAGVVVDAGQIEKVKILVYRESRGWEVRFPFFTNQFLGAQVRGRKDELDRSVEGISGATLSVSAVTRMARLALVLDRKASGRSPEGET